MQHTFREKINAFNWKRNASIRQHLHQLSKEMQGLNWLRNLIIYFQTTSMALLSVALHHVNHPDPHQSWNPPFHYFQSLSPPSSNVVDDLLDTKSNTCLQDDPAYGNECKTIASSFKHGLHCPMDFWLSASFVLEVSCAWLYYSNTLKQYGYSNHKRNM